MKIEKLLKKIKPYNLKLLKETIQDNDYEYLLNKLFDWQEEYDWINWEIFKNPNIFVVDKNISNKSYRLFDKLFYEKLIN